MMERNMARFEDTERSCEKVARSALSARDPQSNSNQIISSGQIERKDNISVSVEGHRYKNVFGDEESVPLRARRFLFNTGESDLLESVEAEKFYNDLAQAALQVVKQNRIQLTLVWPNDLEWPGLVHAIATRIRSIESMGQGLRTAIYPANRRNLSLFKKVHYYGEDLLDEARKAAEVDRSNLHPKYKVYFTLNAFTDNIRLPRSRCNPALSDLVPIFQYDPDECVWGLSEEHYFRETHKALWSSGHACRRATIDEKKSVMDDPAKSTDTFFRIGQDIAVTEASNILLKGGIPGGVDLVLIDARPVLLKHLHGWRSALPKMLVKACLSDDCPSMLIITGSLATYRHLRYQFKKELAKKKQSARGRSAVSRNLQFDHLLRISRGPWKKTSDKASVAPSGDTQFETITTGQEVYKVTSKMYDLANRLDREGYGRAAVETRTLAGFVRNVANAPVGQKRIKGWIEKTGEGWSSDALTRRSQHLLWTSRKLLYLRVLQSLGMEDRHDVNGIIEKGSRLMEKYADRTDVQDTLLRSAEWHLIEGDGGVVVIVPHAIYVDLLKELFIHEFGETILGILQIIKQEEFERTELLPQQRIIIAGNPEAMIGPLLTRSHLPESVTLIFNARGAILCKRELEEILQIQAFKVLHGRARSILNQLTGQLEGLRSAGPLDEWSLGILAPPLMIHGVGEPGEPAAVLHLIGFGELPVGKTSQIIIYKPKAFRQFKSKSLDSLVEGDQIFIFTETLKNRMQTYLERYGKKIGMESVEQLVASFHETVTRHLELYFKNRYRVRQARAVLAQMISDNPALDGQVTESMVVNWIKGSMSVSQGGPVESRSAQKMAHYLAFTDTLRIPQEIAETYWLHGIRSLRAGHIHEGRIVAGILRHILLDPTASVQYGIENEQVEELFRIAASSTYMLGMIEIRDDQVEKGKSLSKSRDAEVA
jgi:hypothetical protein